MAEDFKQTEENIQVDLFGNEVTKKFELRDKYIEPPFSVFDTKQGTWQRRRNKWKALGIESELGRKVDGAHFAGMHRQAERSGKKPAESTQRILDVGEHSIFDPVVCELAYLWFSGKENAKILGELRERKKESLKKKSSDNRKSVNLIAEIVKKRSKLIKSKKEKKFGAEYEN